MMTAILIACLLSAPADCRSVELYLVERMPVPQMIEAQTRAVDWLEQHPGMVKRSLVLRPGRAA